jgi:hypothetical protein
MSRRDEPLDAWRLAHLSSPITPARQKIASYSERQRATVRVPLSLSVRTQPFAFPGTMDTEWLRAHLVRWDALGRLSVPQP